MKSDGHLMLRSNYEDDGQQLSEDKIKEKHLKCTKLHLASDFMILMSHS